MASTWDSSLALRGVSEGDATRYALSRAEPLRTELEAFRDLVGGEPRRARRDAPEGMAALRSAEAVLAERAERGRDGPARAGDSGARNAVVVALGKIGLPLAAHIARAGHRWSAATSTRASSSS